eukprot:10689055-Lingulodinium_polyedra.AAC.1
MSSAETGGVGREGQPAGRDPLCVTDRDRAARNRQCYGPVDKREPADRHRQRPSLRCQRCRCQPWIRRCKRHRSNPPAWEDA